MATIERRIDALGGAPNSSSDYDVAFNEGYSEALGKAMEIGAESDEQIEELIGWIEDALNGQFHDLADWAADARRVVDSMKIARSR